MISDGTKFGMLVKFFPYEALNSIIYLSEDHPGKTIVFVKPEYASLSFDKFLYFINISCCNIRI